MKVTPSELEAVTGAKGWCDVCKGWKRSKEAYVKGDSGEI